MFSTLENTAVVHEITNNDPGLEHNLSEVSIGDTPGNSTITQFNPDSNRAVERKNGLEPSTGADIITHEGNHMYDRYKGTMGSRDPRKHSDGVSDAEVDAVNTNNILRYAQDRPLLYRYGPKSIDKSRIKDPKTYNPNKKG